MSYAMRTPRSRNGWYKSADLVRASLREAGCAFQRSVQQPTVIVAIPAKAPLPIGLEDHLVLRIESISVEVYDRVSSSREG